jgi:hypothetical protein
MKPAAQREDGLRFGGTRSPAAEELEGVQQQLDGWRILLISYSGMTSAGARDFASIFLRAALWERLTPK